MMLQQDNPKDYVISSGRTESVRRFVEISASALGWGTNNNNKGIIWEGEGLNEVGKRADNGETIIRIDPKYFRPTEVDYLQGDSSIAQIELGWKPTISLEQIISEMITNDTKEAKKDLILKNEGFPSQNSLESISDIMN